MKPQVIIDTGPLVALLNAKDAYHAWVEERLKESSGAPVTCESVVSEAFFLLNRTGNGTAILAEMLDRRCLVIAFSLSAECKAVCTIMRKYSDVPCSLADACLVRMSEQLPDHRVLTLDSDFRYYRRLRNHPLPLITPQ